MLFVLHIIALVIYYTLKHMEKCGDKTVFRNNTKERQLKREEALLGEKLLEQEIHQVCF